MTGTVRGRWFNGLVLFVALLGSAVTAQAAESRAVLVLGGTGQLGAEIVRLLVRNGDRVTVFARPTSDRSRLKGLPVNYAVGDLKNDADVAAALRGGKFDAVVVAVRVMDGDIHFYETIMKPVTVHAKATGVAQIIHHAAVGAGANAAKFKSLGWDKVPALMDRLRDQGVGEEILRASGVPYTIIRNSRLHPDGTPSTGNAELTEDESVLTPMTRADLALFTLQCLGKPSCLNKTYHVRDPSLTWPPPTAEQ